MNFNIWFLEKVIQILFFDKQHFHKQNQVEISKKIKQKKIHYLKIISFFHPCYNPKIIGHILKYLQINKCVMKMKMKIKSRSLRYDINLPGTRPGHKHTKYKVSRYDDPHM